MQGFILKYGINQEWFCTGRCVNIRELIDLFRLALREDSIPIAG